MALSPRSIETLIDLVENKLSDMQIIDRDDRREASTLMYCISELNDLKGIAGSVALRSVARSG